MTEVYTRLTAEIRYCDGSTTKTTHEVDRFDLSADDFVDEVVRPIMLAIGYSEETVNEALNGEG